MASVTDETGDQVRQADDLPDVDPTRERDGVTAADVLDSTDIAQFDVTANPATNTTEMALTFNGNAQDALAVRGVSMGAGIQLFLADGRIVEILLRSDGSVKLIDTDRPPGTSITAEWVSPRLLLFILTGFAADPGTEITARTFLEAFEGYMSDVVTALLAAS